MQLINKLAYKIVMGYLVLDKKVVILHGGTNNIEMSTVSSIYTHFNQHRASE